MTISINATRSSILVPPRDLADPDIDREQIADDQARDPADHHQADTGTE